MATELNPCSLGLGHVPKTAHEPDPETLICSRPGCRCAEKPKYRRGKFTSSQQGGLDAGEFPSADPKCEDCGAPLVHPMMPVRRCKFCGVSM